MFKLPKSSEGVSAQKRLLEMPEDKRQTKKQRLETTVQFSPSVTGQSQAEEKEIKGPQL